MTRTGMTLSHWAAVDRTLLSVWTLYSEEQSSAQTLNCVRSKDVSKVWAWWPLSCSGAQDVAERSQLDAGGSTGGSGVPRADGQPDREVRSPSGCVLGRELVPRAQRWT